MSQATEQEEAIKSAAELVENQFGVGIYFETLQDLGVNWQTQQEQDELLKMAGIVLRERPVEKRINASSPILKAAAAMQGRPATQPSGPSYDLNAVVDAAMSRHPELAKAASVYADALQAQG